MPPTVSGDQTSDEPAPRRSSNRLAARASYQQHGSHSNEFVPFQSAPPVPNSMSSTVLPPPGLLQPEMSQSQSAGMDTTGQIAPPGSKPSVTTTLWEDEGSLCYQVECKGICVARREDNNMINGTKLLDVAGLTRGRRDGILKSEKVRHVAKIGPMHLKGVWIPFERALDFANKGKITEMLYPLFVHNIGPLLSHPSSQTRTKQAIAAAEHRKAEAGVQMRNNFVSGLAPPPGVQSSNPQYSIHQYMAQPGTELPFFSDDVFSIDFLPRPSIAPSSFFLSPPYPDRDPSHPESSYILNPDLIPRDAGASAAGFMPVTPAVSVYEESSSPEQAYSNEFAWKSAEMKEVGTFESGCEGSTKTRSSTAIGKVKNEKDHTSSDDQKHIDSQCHSTSRSGTAGIQNYVSVPEAPGESKNGHAQVGKLSPSQNSPQSDSEHSSDSEAGLLTRNERRGILLERLMAYFYELLSSCPSPVPITTAESPMLPNTRNQRQPTEHESTPAPLLSREFLDQSVDRQASLSVPHSQSVLQDYQRRASSLDDDDYQEYKDQDGGPVKDGRDPAASQSNISGSVAASENRQSCASHQSNRSVQKRDREKEDDDKDERQPGKRTRIDNDKNTAPKRLACPYFKNDPEHPRLGRSCSGPGWGTVHRIKEHLDRNHALPPSCVRCYTAFETETDRDSHMRLQNQCQVNERPGRMHGFDTTQKEQLRSRPTGYKHMNETQKWCHIYMILFPETASTDVPSPYYEFVSLRDSGHSVDPMSDYENFLRHEMPDRVRHQLELRIDEALNPLEETLRGQIVDIVRNVQLELFEIYRASLCLTRLNGDSVQESTATQIDDNPEKSRDEEREDTDARDSTWVSTSTEPSGQVILGQSSLEEQLEAYRQAPPLDSPFADLIDFGVDFDGTLFDLSIPAAEDSTYGTGYMLQKETDKDEFNENGTGI